MNLSVPSLFFSSETSLLLLHDKQKQSTLIDNILKLGKPNAAIEIAQQVLSLVK